MTPITMPACPGRDTGEVRRARGKQDGARVGKIRASELRNT